MLVSDLSHLYVSPEPTIATNARFSGSYIDGQKENIEHHLIFGTYFFLSKCHAPKKDSIFIPAVSSMGNSANCDAELPNWRSAIRQFGDSPISNLGSIESFDWLIDMHGHSNHRTVCEARRANGWCLCACVPLSLLRFSFVCLRVCLCLFSLCLSSCVFLS